MPVSFSPRGGLFLDRDGVVNVDRGYVHRPDQIEFVPGVFDLGRTAMRLNLPIMVITNQAGIARALYSPAQFHDLMDWMAARFAREGVAIARIEHSPWFPPGLTPPEGSELLAEWVRDSWWRKPGAGMVRRAAMAVGVDPAQSVLVGDRAGDIAAGREAGVRATIQFVPETPSPALDLVPDTPPGPAPDFGADYRCRRHEEVIEILERLYG
ncbi:MAG: HAD-IIIA family hydrolase [Rhodospirillaceae bacterium]|nr:HAD-IIIA family hydrolase [Rhodospirillaceae bacterium]MCY4064884.1 HAD-IIIA family hydrolase [Rhodospirillaceae bacterium]